MTLSAIGLGVFLRSALDDNSRRLSRRRGTQLANGKRAWRSGAHIRVNTLNSFVTVRKDGI